MENCIFCKIAKGEIPADIIYEDKDTLAFLDVSPINKGHTLVIPKQHYETIMDIPDALLEDVIKTVKKISMALSKISEGITLAQNNKEIAGQLVPHLHFHIIPQYKDNYKKIHLPTIKYKDGEARELVKKIKSLL